VDGVPARWTQAWIEALDEAVAAVGGTGGEPFVIQQVVDDDGVARAWHVTLGPDRTRVAAGEADDPDVTFRQDRDTAEAIARGELAAGRALAAGRLTVRGATAELTRHRDLLARLDEAWAGVPED